MNYSSTAKQGARNAIGAAVYIVLVAWLMSHGESLMRDVPGVVAAVYMLTLFVVSALITGTLVLWGPVKLLVDGKKQEAGTMLFVTGGVLFLVLVVVGLVLVLR